MYKKKYLTAKEELSLQTRLKELRLSKGFTQQQMADALFISRECWGNYETGQRMPSADFIKSIADYFGVDVNYVMGTENSNIEVTEFLYQKIRSSKYLTPEGYLDISDLSTMDKIMMIDLHTFLKARQTARKKQHPTA